MTRYFFSLLISLTLLAYAQAANASKLRTRITDDGQTLSIQLDGQQNGQTIHLNRRYDVTGKTPIEKEWIKYHAFTSVGVMLPLDEMPTLILAPLVLLIFGTTLLILRYQARQKIQNTYL